MPALSFIGQTEVILLRQIAQQIGVTGQLGQTEVVLLQQIAAQKGVVRPGQTEVVLLRQIVAAYGLDTRLAGTTEVVLLQQWAILVGVERPGQTEVILLQQILIAIAESGPAPPVDPLAGISFFGRWQTHDGDNVPVRMWQDVAMTIPAVNAFDPVAAWVSKDNPSRILTQSDSNKRPILNFAGSGSDVPVLEGDGLDDILLLDSFVDSNTQNITFQAEAFVGGFARLLGFQVANRGVGPFGSGGEWGWFSSQAGSVVDSPSSATQWHVLTLDMIDSSTATWYGDGVAGTTFDPSNPSGGSLRLLSDGVNTPIWGQVSALFLPISPTPVQIALMASYLSSLNPSL